MIDFVLNDARRQTFDSELATLACRREPAHNDALRALHYFSQTGNAQAAFLAFFGFLARFKNLRIDQCKGRQVILLRIDDNDAFANPDLRRGQANAFFRIHRFKHVADQLPGYLRNVADLVCPLPQHRVAENSDIQLHCGFDGSALSPVRMRAIFARMTTTRVFSPVRNVTRSS
jgi:hypothetical protein